MKATSFYTLISALFTMENFRTEDNRIWDRYTKTRSTKDQTALLNRMNPIIQKQVNKWQGSVPRNVLESQAKRLAVGAFDSFDPSKGAALSTHVTNNLAPLSRTVYTYQNTARLPENISLKVQAFNAAKDDLTTRLGREPTTDELHGELGWPVSEINRIDGYMRKDLVESVGGLNESFYGESASVEEDQLASLFFSLTPDEKALFEVTTGYNNKPVLDNPTAMAKLGLSQAQLSYKKNLLRKKIERIIGE